jgi:hypothetical protein
MRTQGHDMMTRKTSHHSSKLKPQGGSRPPLRLTEAEDAARHLGVGLAKIRSRQRAYEEGVLHGSYGKQAIVETICQVSRDLAVRQLAAAVDRLLSQALSGRSSKPFDRLESLIRVALPLLEPGVVSNWADAIRLANHRHIRSDKIRGFLWSQGGINRAAQIYRQRDDERATNDDGVDVYDEPYRKPRKRRAERTMPPGMQTLY